MSRIRPLCLDADSHDRSLRADVLLREEPAEEEDEEEDEGSVTEDEGDEEDDGGYSVRECRQWGRMKREDFVKVAEETLDLLPEEFRIRIQNVAILVEDFPANQRPPKLGQRRRLLLGIFHGVPATKRSVFNLPTGPDHIVLYQKNIEAVCTNEADVRHQIRQTLIHELGHYFGMTEEQLKDV